MQTLLAEAIGTMLLVLLGDGVVANVVLNRTKGQNSGWIVITVGWGVAVAMAVYAVGRISGAHLNPAVTDRAGRDRQLLLGRRAGLHRGADDRRVPRRRSRLAGVPAALGRDRRIQAPSWPCSATGPAIRDTGRELHHRDHRHRGAALRHPGHRRQRADAVEAGRRRSVVRLQPRPAAAARRRARARHRRSRSAARPATRSIRPAISARASRTPSCRFPARAISDWDYAGSRSSRRSSAASSARDSISLIGF